MSPFNAAGGEGSTWLCKGVYRGRDHAAARTVLTREGVLTQSAQAKKSARAGEHRADGKSLRGVNSKGRGNLAAQPPCLVCAALLGREPGWRTTIGHKDVACRGIVGDEGATRRNKMCRIAIECKCCKNPPGVVQQALESTFWGTSAAPAQSHDSAAQGRGA